MMRKKQLRSNKNLERKKKFLFYSSLKEPTLYMCPMNRQDKCSGVSSFWTLTGGLWCLIDEIFSDDELVATVVLDLPIFDEDNPCFEAHGTIFCEFDDKLFQTPVPPIKLQATNVVDGSCAIDFSEDAKYNILALKVNLKGEIIIIIFFHTLTIILLVKKKIIHFFSGSVNRQGSIITCESRV